MLLNQALQLRIHTDQIRLRILQQRISIRRSSFLMPHIRRNKFLGFALLHWRGIFRPGRRRWESDDMRTSWCCERGVGGVRFCGAGGGEGVHEVGEVGGGGYVAYA